MTDKMPQRLRTGLEKQTKTESGILIDFAVDVAKAATLIETQEGLLDQAKQHLANVLFSDPGPKEAASRSAARTWWIEQDRLEQANGK